jgi:hypothetical protein
MYESVVVPISDAPETLEVEECVICVGSAPSLAVNYLLI